MKFFILILIIIIFILVGFFLRGQYNFNLGVQTLIHLNRIATTTGSAGQVLMLSNNVWTPSATSSNTTSSATNTVIMDTTSATQGACLKMKNATGTGYTYMTVGYGVATFSTIPCD